MNALRSRPVPPKRLANAPDVIRQLDRSSKLALLLFGLGTLGGFVNAYPGILSEPSDLLGGLLAAVLFFMPPLSVLRALRSGRTADWHIVRVIQIIGLILVPIGTIFAATILASWGKPEVKEWFGVA